MREARRVVLASGSKARRDMLAAAGVVFDVAPANVDEPAIRDSLLAADPRAAPAKIALTLAEAKAREVSTRMPGALVIGGDQVLALGSRLFDKPGSFTAARAQLSTLRGGTHELHSAVCLARDAAVRWSFADSARMTMREFSDAFLDAYLDEAGDAVTQSVGAYHLEGRGIQLFDAIEGDYFSVLGMPLLPLVNALRAEGALPA